jgi:hypothetical protein
MMEMDLNYAKALGHAARQAGQPAAPIHHPEIFEAISDLPVGGGAAEIFRAYSDGWTKANMEDRSWIDCRCVMSCADDPVTACSLSGEPHVHPDDGTNTFGRCPVHPDAPGDL